MTSSLGEEAETTFPVTLPLKSEKLWSGRGTNCAGARVHMGILAWFVSRSQRSSFAHAFLPSSSMGEAETATLELEEVVLTVGADADADVDADTGGALVLLPEAEGDGEGGASSCPRSLA